MPENKLHADIVTPYEIFFDDLVDMVIITSKEGEIGILPGHASMMAALVPGEIRFRIGDEVKVAVSTNGYAEVGKDQVNIIVNAAEWAQDIDLPRARRALKRAEERYNDPTTDPQERNHARHGIERAKARIKTGLKFQNEKSAGAAE
jgi:F-type H+-transporting ATPase subunit epsilon